MASYETSSVLRQKHLEKYEDGELILFVDGTQGVRVRAHMPENISFGVGSRFTDPFARYSNDGTLHALFTEFSQKSLNTGFVTKKVFTGPEQPDITLDIKFEAFYDAYEEVVAPVRELMKMSTGVNEDVVNLLDEEGKKQLNEKVANAASELTFIKAPKKYTIKIGKLARMPNVYISAVNVNFSSVLDYNHFPMSADVSVTLIPETPYTQAEVLYMFGSANSV